MTDANLEPLRADDPDMPEAEQLVLRFLLTRRSGNTRASYGADLGARVPRPGTGTLTEPHVPPRAPDWLSWCRAAGLDPVGGAILEEHVGAWARTLEGAGLAPSTVARKLASVSSWYAWLTRSGRIPVNPAANLPRPHLNPDVSKTQGLTKDQALQLLAYADGARTPSALRNAALAYLLIFTGARVSEATGANLGDLGTDRGHRVLWVTRKGGGDPEPLVVPPPALDRLDAYLMDREDLTKLPALRGEPHGRTAPLIATASGRRMRNPDVWLIMRSLARGAGLPADVADRVGVHSMRHAFATLSLDAGSTLRDLQDAMGHKDPRTTRRYDRARGVLERSPGYKLASYLAEETTTK
jgi:site-specific recombinase XerD